MNWNVERLHLSQNKPLFNRNSQLKKKMSLVQKVKNLHAENIEVLFNELSAENMEQFYSEIIFSLLNVKIYSLEDIKNVLRIIIIYSKDSRFVIKLFSNIKNSTIYWHKIVFIETRILTDNNYECSKDITNLFLDKSTVNKIFYIEYILNFHNDQILLEMANLEKSKIPFFDLTSYNGKEVDRLINTCRSIQIKVIDQKTETEYKSVIETQKNEFDFYTCKFSGDDSFCVPRSSKEILEFLKINSLDINKIDEISKFLRKSENVKMIPLIYNKLKNNMCYLPMLGRIIKNVGMVCKKSINKILSDMLDNKITNRTDLINGIYLITELIKFRYVSQNECFNLLDYFFKQKDIEICCLILKNVGRFYLIDEGANFRTREFLDKILLYGNKCSNIECLFINDMITKVFSKSDDNNTVFFDSFVSEYFQEHVFKYKGEVEDILLTNKKFLFSLFCSPWKFKDINFLIKLAQRYVLDKIVIDFLIFIIQIIGDSYKLRAISYTNFLSGLLRCIDNTTQDNTINSLYKMNIDEESKIRLIISLISGMTYCVKTRHIPILKAKCLDLKSIEIKNLIFNLCESVGERCDISFDEDSLEEDIRLLQTF